MLSEKPMSLKVMRIKVDKTRLKVLTFSANIPPIRNRHRTKINFNLSIIYLLKLLQCQRLLKSNTYRETRDVFNSKSKKSPFFSVLHWYYFLIRDGLLRQVFSFRK